MWHKELRRFLRISQLQQDELLPAAGQLGLELLLRRQSLRFGGREIAMDVRSATQTTGSNVAATIVKTLTTTFTLAPSPTARTVAGRASTSTTTTAPHSTCAARGRDTATRTTSARRAWCVAKTTAKTLETMQTRLRIAAKKLMMMMMILEVLEVVDLEVALEMMATILVVETPSRIRALPDIHCKLIAL